MRKQGNGTVQHSQYCTANFFVLSKEIRFFVWFDAEMAQSCSWIPGVSQVLSNLASACIPYSATCRSCSVLWIHRCVSFISLSGMGLAGMCIPKDSLLSVLFVCSSVVQTDTEEFHRLVRCSLKRTIRFGTYLASLLWNPILDVFVLLPNRVSTRDRVVVFRAGGHVF